LSGDIYRACRALHLEAPREAVSGADSPAVRILLLIRGGFLLQYAAERPLRVTAPSAWGAERVLGTV